jgi:hypothetical protein
MGARTTWKVITNNSGAVTWLYSHWGGDSKFADTQRALFVAEPRWNDFTYGARIFISNIIGNYWNEQTGYGITSTLADDPCPFEESYFYATVDFPNQTITLGSRTWTFEEFGEIPDCSEELADEFWGVGSL